MWIVFEDRPENRMPRSVRNTVPAICSKSVAPDCSNASRTICVDGRRVRELRDQPHGPLVGDVNGRLRRLESGPKPSPAERGPSGHLDANLISFHKSSDGTYGAHWSIYHTINE